MNAAIRAHRILADLVNYRKAEHVDNRNFRLISEPRLGEPVGYYLNPDPDDGVIGILDNGLSWIAGLHPVHVMFSDIAEAVLPSGKESEGLLLILRDGRQIRLPVKGRRGKFFDSMEVLRFLDRVIQDLREE